MWAGYLSSIPRDARLFVLTRETQSFAIRVSSSYSFRKGPGFLRRYIPINPSSARASDFVFRGRLHALARHRRFEGTFCIGDCFSERLSGHWTRRAEQIVGRERRERKAREKEKGKSKKISRR